jgi:AcrR family transcriptional regulator
MTAAERHLQLLGVGRGLFAERGLEGASVEEVAARAGVSKPIVYEHFGGKDGLYAEVVHAEVHALLARLTGALSGDSPRLLLEQATLALLTYVEQCPDGFRILVRESPVAGGTGGFATIMSDVARRVEHLLAQVFLTGGLLPELAPIYSQALVGQVALVGQWWLDHRDHDRDEVAAHLVNLAWNGLAHLQPAPALRSVAVPVPVPLQPADAPAAART